MAVPLLQCSLLFETSSYEKTVSKLNSLLHNRQCCHQMALAKAAFRLGECQTGSPEAWTAAPGCPESSYRASI